MVRRSEFTDAVVKSSGLPFPEDEPDPDFEHFASAPPKLEDLLKEFPLFNTADPKENLSSLIDKFSTEPTPENSASLIHALNVLSPLVQHDQRAKVLVEKGNEVLNTIHITENADIHTRLTLYKHGNFGHPSLHITSNRNYKYQYFRHIYLRDYNLHEAISSLIIMSGESFLPSRTILFGDPDFTGEFRTFTIPSGQQNPATNQVPYIGDDLNDKVSSGLIVNNTGSTWKFPLDRQSGLSDRLRYFFGFIRGMKNIGDPTITWEMFPYGQTGHPDAEDRAFVYIRVPFEVDVSWGSDFSAELRYWSLPYINSQGDIRQHIPYFGAWADNGDPDTVIRTFRELTPTVDLIVDDALEVAIPRLTYEGVYLLPGRGGEAGRTQDDVTLVMERR